MQTSLQNCYERTFRLDDERCRWTNALRYLLLADDNILKSEESITQWGNHLPGHTRTVVLYRSCQFEHSSPSDSFFFDKQEAESPVFSL